MFFCFGVSGYACEVLPDDYEQIKQHWMSQSNVPVGDIIYTDANPTGEQAVSPGGPASYMHAKTADFQNGGISCTDNTGWNPVAAYYRLSIYVMIDPLGCSGNPKYQIYYKDFYIHETQYDDSTNDLDGDGVPDADDCNSMDNTVGADVIEDSDGDGIPNDEDIMPNDSTSTQYHVLEKVYNADGELVYQKIMTANDNGSVTGVQTFGDEMLAQQIKAGLTDGTVIENSTYENMFDDPFNTNKHDISELNSDLQTNIDGEAQETGLWNTDQTVTEIDSTPSNETGTSDPGSQVTNDNIDNTDQFSTMINNQGAMIQNQTNQRSISEKTNELLAGIKSEIEGQQETDVYVDTDLGELIGSGSMESYSGTVPDVQFEGVTETELSEYEELNTKKDWYQEIVDVLATNPFTDALEGVELQASGSCSLTWDYKGHTIEMGVCGHEAALNFWGSVILMISGLHAIFIIFKR